MSPAHRKSETFRDRLEGFVRERYGADRGAKRKLALALGRVANGLTPDAGAARSAVGRRDDNVWARDYSPHVSRWLRGDVPGRKLLELLCAVSGRSFEWWLHGGGEATPPAADWSPAEAWVLEGLLETTPLQAHAVFEYRAMVPLALRLLPVLDGPRKTQGDKQNACRRAGRLFGQCLAAPLEVLGVRDVPWDDRRLSQAYLAAATIAIGLIADFADPRAKPHISRRPKRR